MKTFIQIKTNDGRNIIAMKACISPYLGNFFQIAGVEIKSSKPQTARTMQIVLSLVQHNWFYISSYEIISEKSL